MYKKLAVILSICFVSNAYAGSPAAIIDFTDLKAEVLSFEKYDSPRVQSRNPQVIPDSLINTRFTEYWKTSLKVMDCKTISTKTNKVINPKYQKGQIIELLVPRFIEIKNGTIIQGRKTPHNELNDVKIIK